MIKPSLIVIAPVQAHQETHKRQEKSLVQMMTCQHYLTMMETRCDEGSVPTPMMPVRGRARVFGDRGTLGRSIPIHSRGCFTQMVDQCDFCDMKDSTKKVKRSTTKEKKNSLKDVYKERLGDIKKRLEFDKDCLTPTRTTRYGCQASKFTVYGGSAFREAWDEAVIYGTEDEFWEDEEKEQQRINDFQNQHRPYEMLSTESRKAYLQGCEEFEESLFHIIRPQSRERRNYSFRENNRGNPTKNKVTPPVVDPEENGREFVDGILFIGPDDMLSSRSEKSIKSSAKSKSSKRDVLSLENCESSSQVNPNDLNLLCPSKQTQTDYMSITEIQANPEDISATFHPITDTKKCYGDILRNTGQEMHSFTQSLEDLDEAIYLHALARKFHHEKQKTNGHLRMNSDKYAPPDVCVTRESERKHYKHKTRSHAINSKRHFDDFNANAIESDLKKTKLSQRALQDVMTDHCFNSQSTNQLRPSTFLTESIELDVRNYSRNHSAVEDVTKRVANVTYSDQLPQTFKLDKNSESEINDKIPKTEPHHTDLFITSLEKQSKLRHTGDRQDSLKVSGGSRNSRTSQGSSSSRHSEETIFNLTTDFSDKSLKQSNLYLGESPRNVTCDLHDIFNLEHQDHRSHRKSSSIHDAGPMSIKELDEMDDDTLADYKIRDSQRLFQEIKKMPRSTSNIVPKLDLQEISEDHSDSDIENINTDSSHKLRNSVDRKFVTVKPVKPSSLTRTKRLTENFNEADAKRSWCGCEKSNFLQNVRDLRDNINESGRTLYFDPEQALLDAGNCVSLNLSRIENCSSIGPWEVGPYSSINVEKLSIKKQQQTQSHSSPSQQSKAEKKLSQHSAPTKYDSKMSEYSHPNQQCEKHTKTGTEVKFVGLKAMHEDINNRLNQSENVVHMVGMGCSQKTDNWNSYPKLTEKSIIARDVTISKDSQVARCHKKKMEKPKPIHVRSLQIRQSKINSKVNENGKPLSASTHVTPQKERNYIYSSALIKLDRTDLKKPDKMKMAINNLSYSSPNRRVSSHSRTGNLIATDRNSLNFEERGKKLDEICGILSQSLERKSRQSLPDQTKTDYKADCCARRLSDQRKLCSTLDRHVDHLKNLNAGKKVTKSPKPIDIKFRSNQERRSVKPTYYVPEAKLNFGKPYNKEAKSDLFRNDIENFKEFLSDLENESHFDDLNFNSSENLKQSAVSCHQIQNSRNFQTSIAAKMKNEDVAWLSKALKHEDCCEHNSTENDPSSMLTEDEDNHSKSSEDEMALTMSDLYTPVTQLISEEYDDNSSEKSTTIQESDLPLKTVYQNLINHRKAKCYNDLNEKSGKRSRNEDISSRTSTNSICYNSRETPTRDFNTSLNKKPG
ncbi:hypothetical protein LOTGIDRAFT_158476 [Lottia gigantea]|uniref:Uncharacterized protein n=1 Tax=Lottia gigantea TaxID=225164 RepID=V4AQA3_LOTGI|nr:hypothetical protein LOTGIDRAFT_158476 [Lottia gigantea]ESO99392.1 hypothetical protein LOTGIDRAFT_158476 [Lottia gigantea]